MRLILLPKSEYRAAGSRRSRLFAGPLVEAPGAAFQGLQAEQGAFEARRGQGDAEVREDVVAVERLELVEGLAPDLVGEDRGGGLRDRAALAAERDVVDPVVRADLQVHRDLVAAQ